MDLKIPWKMRLDGAAVPYLQLIGDLVTKDAKPPSEEEEDWSSSGLPSSLSRTAPERSSILESMTALWRLREVESSGVYLDAWKKHVVAWLVSLLIPSKFDLL